MNIIKDITLEIIIDNSFSCISSNTFNERLSEYYKIIQNLQELLSYKIPGSDFSKLPEHLKTKYLFSQGKNSDNYYFPTGLINIVLKYFNEIKIKYKILDSRTQPKTKELFQINSETLHPLRKYQSDIVEKALKDKRGVIESATGTGKTRILIELIHRISLKTLVIVPSISLLDQTKSALKKAFGENDQIIIANYQSLEKLKDSFWKSIDVLIIDEFHHSSASTFQKLNKKFNHIFYRFGLTGTNFRNDGTDLALQGVLSHVIYKFDAITAINQGYLCKPKFYFIRYPHNRPLKGNGWLNEYRHRIVRNDEYNQIIALMANKIIEQGKPLIIFVDEIKHGYFLKKIIPKSFFVNGTQHSEINNKYIEDFNKGKIDCIIGTSIIGEGVDTVRASHAIMAGVGKARSEIIQKIGRLLRPHKDKKFAYIIDFMHHYSHFLYRHSLERENIYKEYQSVIEYINLETIK